MQDDTTPITGKVREELERIRKKHRKLTEEILVAESKKESSPLHDLFLWNDDHTAAHIGRLEIARQLIKRVKITPQEAKQLNYSVQVRKYHGTGDGYHELHEVMTSKDLREILLQRALDELDSFQKRYQQLTELAQIFEHAEVLRKSRKKAARRKTKAKSKARRKKKARRKVYSKAVA